MPTYTANCIYGYFGKQVPVFVNKRLSSMPYAQAGVLVHEYKGKQWVSLISYESLIFSYCPEDNLICFDLSTASPDYSRTTAKHVNAFCKVPTQICALERSPTKTANAWSCPTPTTLRT